MIAARHTLNRFGLEIGVGVDVNGAVLKFIQDHQHPLVKDRGIAVGRVAGGDSHQIIASMRFILLQAINIIDQRLNALRFPVSANLFERKWFANQFRIPLEKGDILLGKGAIIVNG